jgi:electron transport complex protein RnfG
VALIVGLSSSTAFAKSSVYWDRNSLLRDAFKASERVGSVEVTAAEASAALGTAAPKGKYVVYVARTGNNVDGVALIDEEAGQHEPITFGFVVGADGKMKRAEVMVYREPFGDGIREKRFLDQLVGKEQSDAMKLDGVTGATISSSAAARAAHRALVICNVALKKLGVTP